MFQIAPNFLVAPNAEMVLWRRTRNVIVERWKNAIGDLILVNGVVVKLLGYVHLSTIL